MLNNEEGYELFLLGPNNIDNMSYVEIDGVREIISKMLDVVDERIEEMKRNMDPER